MLPRHKGRLAAAAAIVVVAGVGLEILNFAGAPTGLDLRLHAVVAQAMPAPQAGCQPDKPMFYYGFRELHARLGERMGDPTECEQPIHVNGDTRQRTTTGFAYYRKGDNAPTFTNGWDHWALTSDGLVYWAGDVVDPPTPLSAHGAP